MKAKDFLDFAEAIVAVDLIQESSIRSSISRAYYCAFHESKIYLMDSLNIDIDKGKGGTHQRISDEMIANTSNRIKGLGYRMKQLHARRVFADYHLDKEIEVAAAREAIVDCKKIIKDIEDLS